MRPSPFSTKLNILFEHYPVSHTLHLDSKCAGLLKMLFMSYRKVLSFNKMLVRLLDIWIFFTTFHRGKACTCRRVIRSGRSYVFFYYIMDNVKSSRESSRWCRTSIMEMNPSSSKHKLVYSCSKYYLIHFPSSSPASSNPKLMNPLLTTSPLLSLQSFIN